MVTIKDVAERAGVSVGTVSNVLAGTVRVSPKLRERVRRAIAEFDYHPNYVARSLKVRQTMMVGMVIPDITNPFFPQLVRGAEDAALERGFLLVTFNTDDNLDREKLVFSVLRTRRMDGLLLVVAPNDGDTAHIRKTIAAGTPVVCLDRVPVDIGVSSVSVDGVKATEMCMRHLLSLGHRRIAIISGSMALQTARARFEGYRNALAEAKLPFDPRMVLDGDFRSDTGYLLMKKMWLEGCRPTALFVTNGTMGLGAMKAIHELGIRCPDEIALAIYDDLPEAEVLNPPLTAVAQPAYEMGFRGAELLFEYLDGVRSADGPPARIELDAELKIRESTARSAIAASRAWSG